MFQILLIIIYLSFISLGLPDSVLGAAWPIIYGEFDVPVSYAGIVFMIISLGTIISSLPLWKKNMGEETSEVSESSRNQPLSLGEIIRIKGAKEIMFIFFCYCALEILMIVMHERLIKKSDSRFGLFYYMRR